MKAYQLKIKLREASPVIWRKVTVPAGITFEGLKNIINIVMGWSGEHLYCFEFPRLGISIEDDFEEQEIFSVKETTIDRFLTLEKEFEYIYDFGDNWEHSIIVEKEIEDYAKNYAEVLQYKGGNPPEDCGGVGCYRSTEPYDLEEINEELREIVLNFRKNSENNDITLHEILSQFKKNDLVEIAKIHRLHGYSQYRKEEMIDFLCRELFDVNVMRRYFSFLNEDELKLLDSDESQIYIAPDNYRYKYLLEGAYAGCKSGWNGKIIYIPKEVREAYLKNCDDVWKENLNMNRQLLMYLNVAAELYGICPINKAIELYVRDGGAEKSIIEVIEFCENVPKNKKLFTVYKDELILNPYWERSMYSELRKKQAKYSFYEPTKEEIEHLEMKGYLPFNKYMIQLKKFFMKEGEDEQDAEILCCTIQMIIRIGGMLQDVVDVLEMGFMDFEYVVEDSRLKKQLLTRINNVWSHTNMVTRRGHMIEETIVEKSKSNIIAFPGNNR